MQVARLVWGLRGPEAAWIVQGRDDSGLDEQTGIEENGKGSRARQNPDWAREQRSPRPCGRGAPSAGHFHRPQSDAGSASQSDNWMFVAGRVGRCGESVSFLRTWAGGGSRKEMAGPRWMRKKPQSTGVYVFHFNAVSPSLGVCPAHTTPPPLLPHRPSLWHLCLGFTVTPR